LDPLQGLADISAKAPALFLRQPRATERFFDFFTSNIRNKHTRRAYYNAASKFSEFCAEYGVRDLEQVTVSNVWAMDEGLGEAMRRWNCYRKEVDGDSEGGNFANHCPHCGAVQEDYLLHSEPGDVFFGLEMGESGAVEFTAVDGCVGLSGDYGFRI
jgi:hypothetical protein